MNAYKYFILLLLVSLASSNANAQLYMWTNKDGEFYISDRPPLNPNQVKLKNSKRVEPTAKEKRKKPDKKIFAWRCKELKEQYAHAMGKAIRFSTNKNLAATMKLDAENYKLALTQICH